MGDAVLDFAALKAITGYQRQADVERCLKSQSEGLRQRRGRQRVTG